MPGPAAEPGWSPWLRLGDARWWYFEQTLWLPVRWELALGPTACLSDAELRLVATGRSPHERELFTALESHAHPAWPAIAEGFARGEVLYYRSSAKV